MRVYLFPWSVALVGTSYVSGSTLNVAFFVHSKSESLLLWCMLWMVLGVIWRVWWQFPNLLWGFLLGMVHRDSGPQYVPEKSALRMHQENVPPLNGCVVHVIPLAHIAQVISR